MGDNFGLNDNYEYIELELDSLDADGAYGQGYASTDWPMFTIAGRGPIQNVVAVKILEAEINASYYVFNSVNNSFTITESTGGTSTVVIPIGNYTSSTLATALGTAFTTSGTTSTYTVAYVSLTNKFTFTSSSNTTTFYFTFGAGYGVPGVQPNSGNKNPRLFIGFPPGITTSASNGTAQVITSPNCLQISGPPYLYINSSRLGSDIGLYLPSGAFNLGGGKAGPQMAKVPINCNPGGTIIWSDPDPQKWFSFPQVQTLNVCDFYLTLGNTTSQLPLQLNGQGFSIKLGLLIEQKMNIDRVLPTAQGGRVAVREGPKRPRPTF